MRKKEKLEREMKQVKAESDSRAVELKSKQSQVQRSQEEITRLEQQLKEQRVSAASFIVRKLLEYRLTYIRTEYYNKISIKLTPPRPQKYPLIEDYFL